MNLKNTIQSLTLASLLVVLPLAASANTVGASGATGIVISPSGIVRVIGADVTAVGAGVVDAVLNIGNAVINVVLNTSGSTKIAANGSKTATTTDIKVGDTVAFKGTLASSTGTGVTVNATKVRDTTSFPFPRIAAGTISSVNTTNNSFVVTSGNTTTTVFTNALTNISLNGTASTLASLPVNSKVAVVGTQNTDGSITATKVMVNTSSTVGKDNNQNNNKQDNDNDGDNNATSTKHETGDNNGLHLGLNLFGGLHLGKDN